MSWNVGLVQIGKEWLKGRLQVAVLDGENVIAICSEDEALATKISALPDFFAVVNEALHIADDEHRQRISSMAMAAMRKYNGL